MIVLQYLGHPANEGVDKESLDKPRTERLLHCRGILFPALVNRFLHQGIPGNFFRFLSGAVAPALVTECQAQFPPQLRDEPKNATSAILDFVRVHTSPFRVPRGTVSKPGVRCCVAVVESTDEDENTFCWFLLFGCSILRRLGIYLFLVQEVAGVKRQRHGGFLIARNRPSILVPACS